MKSKNPFEEFRSLIKLCCVGLSFGYILMDVITKNYPKGIFPVILIGIALFLEVKYRHKAK